MTDSTKVSCTRCGRTFAPKFSFQSVKTAEGMDYFCSQTCRIPGLTGGQVACVVCDKVFRPTLAIQLFKTAQGMQYVCSEACRAKLVKPAAPVVPKKPARMVAVLNQKGGTAKTTTAVSVASGLAQMGFSTLLIDLDPQGNVGVSLGIKSPRSVYHILFRGLDLKHACVPVRDKLDVITADPSLAVAEIELARTNENERAFVMREKFGEIEGYDYIIFDCAPALSVLNHNALVYAQEVLIPVSCDYLALVGVKQVMQTLRRITEQTGTRMNLAGVVPTFYDVRKRVCVEALQHLRKSFGARALPPVRVNTKLAEAPSQKQTIFEYAPDSNGAKDYIRVVEWLRNSQNTSSVTRAA